MGALEIFKLSWRNLGRNRRRTLITLAAISGGLGMMILTAVLGDGMHGQMISSGVRNQAGHVVIQQKDWQVDRRVEEVVPNTPAVRAKFAELVPSDSTILSRIFFQGLLTSTSSAVGAQFVAVEPTLEAKVGDLDEKIVEGESLQDGDHRGIVIGVTLADVLDVEVGDKIVLMTQRGKDLESQLFRVRGIFKTGLAQLDGFYAQVELSAAQTLLHLGSDVTQLSVHLTEADLADDLARRLQGAFDDPEVQVLGWKKALPDLHQFVVLDDAGGYVFMLVVGLIVAIGILNTILMSVFERTREFGVLLALGLTPRQIAAMVLGEAAMLGAVAVVLGVGLGLLASWPLITEGLDYAQLTGGASVEAAGVALDVRIYGVITWAKVIVFGVVAFVLAILAALYPTWVAARLEPVAAMRHR